MFIAITILLAEVLTLTRRTVFNILAQFLIIYLIFNNFNSRSILPKNFFSSLLVLISMIFVTFIFAPSYFQYTLDGIKNSFGIIQNLGVENSITSNDGRLANDIPKHLARFNSSPILGYGWDPLWYSNKTESGGLSANDVPITAALGMFGIAGTLIYFLFYIKVFKIIRNALKSAKRYYNLKTIYFKKPILFSITIFLSVYFINLHTTGFFNY
tara:strand:- start:143 stop:781 length:639 start_codon:yes stop_codon:yes gene_type:complete